MVNIIHVNFNNRTVQNDNVVDLEYDEKGTSTK